MDLSLTHFTLRLHLFLGFTASGGQLGEALGEAQQP